MAGADDANVDLGFQQNSNKSLSRSTSGMNTDPLPNKVSGLAMSSIPMFKSSTVSDPFYGTHWDPLLAINHNENFGGGSSMVSHCGYANPTYPIDNQGMISSHLVQYPSSDSSLGDLPKIQRFGSGNFSDMAGLYGLPALGAAANNNCYQNYLPNHEVGTHRTNADGARSQDDCQVSGERALEVSPNGKRRRRSVESASAQNLVKMTEGEQQKDISEDGSFDQPSEQDDKKQKQSRSLQNKQSGKQAKDSSQTEDGTKDTYIHMRARRGQATNSHSLAERVRREKISERMKLLQELVPGCNKITGKAVMLDEIINYVQSLQQQVEFLSMKLATVNPESNIDIERMLSKDILNSRGENPVMLGISPGMRNSHPYPHSMLQASMQGIPNSAAQYHHMPQNAWNNDFQSLLQMGFSSNPTADNLGLDGCSKP
ncbi:unnamed protein product [Rhodiola kirilowii]